MSWRVVSEAARRARGPSNGAARGARGQDQGATFGFHRFGGGATLRGGVLRSGGHGRASGLANQMRPFGRPLAVSHGGEEPTRRGGPPGSKALQLSLRRGLDRRVGTWPPGGWAKSGPVHAP